MTTASARPIDCIIVGYNEADPRRMERELEPTREYSGAYRTLLLEPILFRGRKRQYMEVFNELASERDGRDPGYNVYRMPALGVTHLASFLMKRGFRVKTVNYFNADRDDFARMLESSPRAVAITTTFYVSNGPIAELVQFVRERSPQTRIIVGGPRIFNLCSDLDPLSLEMELQGIGADFYVFDSQGEDTLARLLSQLRRGVEADVSDVPNLVFTSDQRRFHTTARAVEQNDLEADAVDWDGFDTEYFVPTALVRTARSCAFQCTFCRYPVLAGALTLRSVENVEAELRQLHAAGVRQLVFIDDTFNVPLSRFKDLCRMMIRNRFEFEWYSYFRCSNSDAETFPLMAESGCRGVFLGIESGDQSILNNMKKCATIGKYENGIEQLKANGIVTFVSIIVGFPGESDATVRNSLRFLQETSPDFYRSELYYHDTKVPIHQEAERFQLRGAGYSWSHASMDWRGACDAIEMMYDTLRGPVILPHGFDLWTIPYLRGQGVSIEQFTAFAGIAQEMLAYRHAERAAPLRQHEQRLARLLAPACVPATT